MSIFETIFGKNNQAQQQQQPQQQQQQAPAQQQNQHVANNPTVPGNQVTPTPAANPNAADPTQSPNDKFSNLWENVPKQGSDAPNFKINPEQLKQVSTGMDFSRNVSRDDLAKIAQGGEEAVAALTNVLNSVGRDIFNANAQFSSHMTETGYNMASQSIEKGMPNWVKQQFAQNELFTANPALRKPSLQPLVNALQDQFSAKHPNATPQEINALVSEYMSTEVAGAFAKPEAAPTQGPRAAQHNFASFLDN